jgi:hypothetical protein
VAGPRAGFIGSGEAMGGFQVLTVVFVSGSPPLFPFFALSLVIRRCVSCIREDKSTGKTKI